MKKGLETGQALQALPLRWLGLRPDADNSEAEIPMYYGTTSEGVNGYIRTSRKLALDYLKQHQSPSYAQMTLPLMPQFRMTRRLVGKEQLEVVPDRYVESSIGCMIHSLEIPAEVYEFPYGGLIDTEITNIAAGTAAPSPEKRRTPKRRMPHPLFGRIPFPTVTETLRKPRCIAYPLP